MAFPDSENGEWQAYLIVEIASCKTFEELPENAQKYISFIEKYIGVPVKFIGTGADREAMIVRADN
jgi:adenylosuccinate synthase